LILAKNITFYIMDKARQAFINFKYGSFPKASDHEETAEVGWLLYSTRQQDEERISEMISNLFKEKIEIGKPLKTRAPEHMRSIWRQPLTGQPQLDKNWACGMVLLPKFSPMAPKCNSSVTSRLFCHTVTRQSTPL